MEFLKNIALPQSAEHIQLLHLMLILVLFLFIPFISSIFGGTSLSLYFKRLGRKSGDDRYNKLSKEVMELVTINKGVGFIIGIVPLFTAILILSQLFQNSENSQLDYFGYTLILVAIALIFIYSYRYSLSFNRILQAFGNQPPNDKEVQGDYLKFSEESKRISDQAGTYGVVILFIALWLFSAGISAAMFGNQWLSGGLFAVLFHPVVILRLILLLIVAFMLAGGAVLFGFFYMNSEKYDSDGEYGKFVRSRIIKVVFTSAIFLPVILLINMFVVPGQLLSSAMFVYVILGLILLFFAYHFLYMLYTKFSSKFTALLFFTLLFLVLSIIINDQFVINNATEVSSAKLADKYEKMLAELKGENGPAELNGEEIYKIHCTACHRLDSKLVGPPHDEVVPKYFGKENQLIAFIRNPVKVNPDYPPMPNPGLKPREAKAVAEYILKRVKEDLDKNK
jgi:cytochrome c